MADDYDIVIIGGGIMGSSLAYNLRADGFTGRVAVVEKDPTYRYACTWLSDGGVRASFTDPLNIRLSQYSLEMFRHFEKEMAVNGDRPGISLTHHGYLYLATDDMMDDHLGRVAIQRNMGVDVHLLSRREVQALVPELNVADLAGGAFDADAILLDPRAVLRGYIRKAQHLDVEFITGEVTAISASHGAVDAVVLADRVYRTSLVVNAASAWAAGLSRTVGLPLPVVAVPVQKFRIRTSRAFSAFLPSVLDSSGVSIMDGGRETRVGYLPAERATGYDFSWDPAWFHAEVLPRLVHRCALYEDCKIIRGWAGLYEFNPLDHNGIVGRHPDLDGYFFITGFSGHGFQQGPAVGKCMSELVRTGRYETIDLSAMSVERFARREFITERAVYA